MSIVKVQKANKILRVDELLIDKYLKLGYSQIDDEGKIVKRGNSSESDVIKNLEAEIAALKKTSNDVKTLKAQIKTLAADNKALTDKNASLVEELAAAKTELEALKAEKSK